MKIGQFKKEGKLNLIVVQKNNVYQNSLDQSPKSTDLISSLKEETLTEAINKLIKKKKLIKISDTEKFLFKNNYLMLKPVDAMEAWAAGVTYKRQAIEHDNDLKKKGKNDDLYQYAYKNQRVEIFFKGTSRTMVGPYEKLWLRSDSKLIMPEAELVLVIGSKGLPVAYTLGNDLTAWDIESECPLYLSQAKIWEGSGSIGPWIVPVEDFETPYSFEINCVVKRNNSNIINSVGNTSGLKRSIEELCYYMNLSNKTSPGTVLFTGTACIIDHKFTLKEGDIVEVSNSKIGILSNEVLCHSKEKKKYMLRENK